MTTFDGSTSQQPTPARDSVPTEAAPVAAWDAIEAVRQQLDAREEAEDTTVKVEIPQLGLRMVCDADFSYATYADWQRRSFPPSERNKRRGPNVLTMDQAQLAQQVLLNTCVGMEYQDPATQAWLPLTDSRGEAATPQTDWFMNRFNEVDPGHFVRRLFGTDALMMRGSELVTTAAGWGEQDTDPTD